MNAGLSLPNCRVWRLGADVDTDVLAPGVYMKGPIEELARHCLEALDPAFAKTVRPGDVVVFVSMHPKLSQDGRNFIHVERI